MLITKPKNMPMDPRMHMYGGESEKVDNSLHNSMIPKILYVTIAKKCISLMVGKLSKFMDRHKKKYWDDAMMVYDI